MMLAKGYEFICRPIVRVLRWNEKFLNFPNILVFRLHDTIQAVKYDSGILHVISFETKLSLSHPVPFQGCCSDRNYFVKVVRNALDSLSLFQSYNNELLTGLIPSYFYSCYNPNCTPDPTSHKIILVVEIFRNTVYSPGSVYFAEEATKKDEENLAEAIAIKLHAEKLGELHLHCEEYYYKPVLNLILRKLVEQLRTVYGYQLPTPGTIGDLVQVKAAIKLVPFNGRRRGEDECAICWEGFCEERHLARMPCSHIFHKSCVFLWLLQEDSCPLCRRVCKTPIM